MFRNVAFFKKYGNTQGAFILRNLISTFGRILVDRSFSHTVKSVMNQNFIYQHPVYNNFF